ncbi:MAG: Uma2 family endonuclease [Chloroflexi bacterium]|nr:Uma2 family endonuclease [Chloroflexota bacterium]
MVTAVRWTVDEYVELARLLQGRRTELIDGQVIEMPSIGTAHFTVVQRLARTLNALNAVGRLVIQQPLRIPAFDEPEPDLQILRWPVELRKPAPVDELLVIEVADTTYAYDRRTKLPLYLRAGVRSVWIANISDHAQPRLELYDSATEPTAVLDHGTLTPPEVDVVVDLDALFAGIAGLPVDEQPPELDLSRS